MKLFRNLSENLEEMKDFEKKVSDDDEKFKEYLDTCSHKEFIASIMHVGVLLDTITTYFGFIQPKMTFAIADEEKRSRKINKYLNDLNKKINNEYGFDENTFIVEEGVLYDNQVYLYINKCQFIKVLELNEL